MSPELLLFDALAAVALFSAAAMVLVARTAVAAATALIVCLSALSAVLVVIGAELVGVVLLIVSAGAVSVLVLMIFLLVGAEGARRTRSRLRDTAVKLVGCSAAAGIALVVVHMAPGADRAGPVGSPTGLESLAPDSPPALGPLGSASNSSPAAANLARPPALDATTGGHRAMGLSLFRRHLLPLEVLSLVLLSALVGSVALAGRREAG